MMFQRFVFICTLLIAFAGSEKLQAQTLAIDTIQLNKLMSDWNNANNLKDTVALNHLYANSILYYGKQQNIIICIQSKLSLFKKHPDYHQQIFGTVQFNIINDNEIKCSFLKRATFNQQTKDYPSYLIFSIQQNEWRIITESDLITDKNLAKSKDIKMPKDAIKGDFDGNGTIEYAWLVPPETNMDSSDCLGDCTSYIRFSDNTIPPIEIKQCIGGQPTNLDDLNNNKTDEIGLSPEWFTSCWSVYYVYTLKDKKWRYAVDPFRTHCDQWEAGVIPIEIDKKKKGNVIIRYSDDPKIGDIVTKEKSIPVK